MGDPALAAAASPLARYAASVLDQRVRFARSPGLRATETGLSQLMDHEAARLQTRNGDDWAGGAALLSASGLDTRMP